MITAAKAATAAPTSLIARPPTAPLELSDPLADAVPFVPAAATVEPEGQVPFVDVDAMDDVE